MIPGKNRSSYFSESPKLDFGQFSLRGSGHFAGIFDADGNFRTVPGAPGTHQKFRVPRYSRAFRASATSKIGQSPAKAFNHIE
jgi:hypothetical protein